MYTGVSTQFVWHGTASATPAVMIVHGAGGKGLKLMHCEGTHAHLYYLK